MLRLGGLSAAVRQWIYKWRPSDIGYVFPAVCLTTWQSAASVTFDAFVWQQLTMLRDQQPWRGMRSTECRTSSNCILINFATHFISWSHFVRNSNVHFLLLVSVAVLDPDYSILSDLSTQTCTYAIQCLTTVCNWHTARVVKDYCRTVQCQVSHTGTLRPYIMPHESR